VFSNSGSALVALFIASKSQTVVVELWATVVVFHLPL
ncbi:hypothetical protein A2U01_0041061, partial [Trifolium medium]|nr:hypothetical protein [Trifolium medium]